MREHADLSLAEGGNDAQAGYAGDGFEMVEASEPVVDEFQRDRDGNPEHRRDEQSGDDDQPFLRVERTAGGLGRRDDPGVRLLQLVVDNLGFLKSREDGLVELLVGIDLGHQRPHVGGCLTLLLDLFFQKAGLALQIALADARDVELIFQIADDLADFKLDFSPQILEFAVRQRHLGMAFAQLRRQCGKSAHDGRP